MRPTCVLQMCVLHGSAGCAMLLLESLLPGPRPEEGTELSCAAPTGCIMLPVLAVLERRLANRQRLSLVRPRSAAVLLALFGTDEDNLSLLLTRRATAISHAGQVAFPGGKVDPADCDRPATALREATEEVSLPAASVRVLGLLDDIPNWDNTLAVTPVVGHIEPSTRVEALVAQPDEVAGATTFRSRGSSLESGPCVLPARTAGWNPGLAGIFTVPLSDLQTASRWTVKEAGWHGVGTIQQYYFSVDTYRGAGEGPDLWGLTSYATIAMLTELPGCTLPASFAQSVNLRGRLPSTRLTSSQSDALWNPRSPP